MQDLVTKRWYEVGDDVAREKVGQQLRDCLKSTKSVANSTKAKPQDQKTPISPIYFADESSKCPSTQLQLLEPLSNSMKAKSQCSQINLLHAASETSISPMYFSDESSICSSTPLPFLESPNEIFLSNIDCSVIWHCEE
jgi:hypothetical protein